MQTVANHQQDNFKMLANCSFWEQFHSDFEKHASHIDVLSAWVQPAMLTLYSQIYNKSKYQHAIERAKNQIIKNNNLVIPLFNEDFLRVYNRHQDLDKRVTAAEQKFVHYVCLMSTYDNVVNLPDLLWQNPGGQGLPDR